jgi:uncharacterized protein (DUF1778 family)
MIKIRPTPEEKAIIERAAIASRRSVNQWAIGALLEQAAREGITAPPPPAKARRAKG